MSLAMLLKIFSDCCIIFGVLASGPVSFQVPLLIPALICGVSVAIATFFHGKGWKIPRRLCAVLPLSCLLLADGIGQLLILAAPAIYAGYVIVRSELELEYYSFRRFFQGSLWLLVVIYLLENAWIFLSMITNDGPSPLDPSSILRYGLVHLLCGIVLQRQLRLGVGNRAEGGRRQMVLMLGTAGAIAGGFIVAEPLLRKGIGALAGTVFSVVMTPFALLAELIAKLVEMMIRTEEDKETYDEFLDYMESIGLGGVGGETAPPPEGSAPEGIDLTAVWITLASIFLLVVAVLLLRSFHKRRGDSDGGPQVRKLVTAPKKKKESAMSNRGRVRQLYRDFLRAEKSLGMKLTSSDTSQDVLHRIHKDTDAVSAQQLRNVYLAARYDERQNISRNQVDAAKRALKGTRKPKT